MEWKNDMLTQGIYQFVRKEEGGLANIKGDSGGLTKFGVTHTRYDVFRDSKDLPRRSVLLINEDEVFVIYDEYWRDAHCDLLDWPVNIVHFTFAFNSGNVQAIKILQRALNVAEDGVVGAITNAAIKLANRDRSARFLVAYRLLLEQVFYYDSLDEDHPDRTKFVTGFWLKRIKHVLREIERTSARPEVI